MADTSVTDFVAYLMETDAALVEKVMVSKVVETQRGGRRGARPLLLIRPLTPRRIGLRRAAEPGAGERGQGRAG